VSDLGLRELRKPIFGAMAGLMPAYKLRSLPPARRESQTIAALPMAERVARAANALETAEELLSRGLLEQAGERFQAAARAYDEIGDSAGGARALLGLGRVLLGLEDPACREVLEDAGTWLEDLGDEAAVREVDGLLRIADRSIDESPRSFHAIPLHDVRESLRENMPKTGQVRGSSSVPPPRVG
jgi:hypothetical protein